MKIGTIYLIKCLETGKLYLGKTTQPVKKRWSNHKSTARKGYHKNKDLQADWNAHGEESFIFSVLETCDRDKLPEKEDYWIKTIVESLGEDVLYNQNKADRVNSFFSDEIRKKMRQSQKWDKNGNAKLTLEQQKEIKRLIKQGLRITDIAKMFDISPSYVCSIKAGRKLKYLRVS